MAPSFFVTFKPCEHLDGKHTVFGYVDEADWPVLQDIERTKTKGDRPSKIIKIFSVNVLEDPWSGEKLPPGARIPERPLVNINEKKDCAVM
mmetsp:Transcript_21162/g.53907  ORF Transcript_21162/g.53907 Transcript_21162/m.53907 type:complete len:91 (+) Transcript_21162:324-596(+)